MTEGESRRTSKEFLLVAMGQALAAVGSLVGVRLLTNALPPSAYGELALAMTGVTLAQQTLVLPLGSAALRFLVPSQETGEVGSYVRILRRLTARTVMIQLLLGSCICLWLIVSGAGRSLPLVVASVLFTTIVGIGYVIDGVQNAARRRTVTAWHDVLSSWSRFLLAALFVHLSGAQSSSVAMMGYVVAAIATLFSQAVLFPPRLPVAEGAESRSEADLQRRMLKFATPLGFFGLSFALQMFGERWSLRLYGSTADVGHYAVLIQLGYYPIVTLSNLLVQLATPIVYARAGDGQQGELVEAARRLVYRFLALVTCMTVLGVLIGWAAHRLIFAVFVAPQYAAMSRLLPAVVLSAGLLACGQVTALVLLLEHRSRALVFPKLATGVLTALGSVVGARYLGVAGVVASSVLMSGLYFSWVLLLSRRIVHATSVGLATEPLGGSGM